MKLKNIIFLILSSFAGSAFSQSAFDNHDLCKAAISSVMGRPVNSMVSMRSKADSPEIFYTRKEDGSKHRYNCKFQGNKIIWRAYFDDPVPVGWGRWRDHELDPVIMYTINGDELKVLESDSEQLNHFKRRTSNLSRSAVGHDLPYRRFLAADLGVVYHQ